MGNVRIVHDMLIESNELNRMIQFLNESINMLRTPFVKNYGIIDHPLDVGFSNFKIVRGGTSTTIALDNWSYAMDVNGNAIIQHPLTAVEIPDDGHDYYLTAKHKHITIEEGTVSITADGIMTGSDTRFTDVLRGQPNYPTRVKFYDTSYNTGKYQVVEVISDTEVKLVGEFYPETGLKYSVIGTFTPTSEPVSPDDEIYRYDSCAFSIISDAAYNPSALVEGEEFLLALVKYEGGNMVIEDMRSAILRTVDFELLDGSMSADSIVGIESVKWGNEYDTRERNELTVSWGFRSTNWLYEPTLRRITILSGEGGVYKSTTQFVNGKFDGWRLYAPDGSHKRVISSSLSGTSIVLEIAGMNVNDYPAGTELLIVPDVEEVEIMMTHNNGVGVSEVPQVDIHRVFPVNMPTAKIDVLVPSGTSYLYGMMYRHKRSNRYTDWQLVPEDTVGYYDEASYANDTADPATPDGVLNDELSTRTRVPYTPSETEGFILVKPAPNSYRKLIDLALTGDRFGIATRLLNNDNPVVNLVVGIDEEKQHITGSVAAALTVDHIINLDRLESMRDGNKFTLIFDGSIDLDGNKISINEGYVSPSVQGTVLFEFTIPQVSYFGMAGKQTVLEFTYDAETDHWIMHSTEVQADSGWQAVEFDTDHITVNVEYQPMQFRYLNGVVFLRCRTAYNFQDAPEMTRYYFLLPKYCIPTSVSGFSFDSGGHTYKVLKADDPEGLAIDLAPSTDYCYLGFVTDSGTKMLTMGGSTSFCV